MSYLFEFGNTPAALLLAQLLDEVGDDREKRFVSKSIKRFGAELNELNKVEPCIAIKLMHMLHDDYKNRATSVVSGKILNVYLNVVTTKFKMLLKVRRKQNQENNIVSVARSKSFNTPETTLKSRIMNPQDKLNEN